MLEYLDIPYLHYVVRTYWSLPGIFWRRARRAYHFPQYWKNKRQLFGFVTRANTIGPRVWMHGDANAEILACLPLVRHLQRNHPGLQVVFTTSHPAGIEQIQTCFGPDVGCYYLPLDIPSFVRRFLARLSPRVLILSGLSLSPVLLRECHGRGIPVVMANVTIRSDYIQYWDDFYELRLPALKTISYIGAIRDEDRQCLIDLGYPAERCNVTGDTKFGARISSTMKQQALSLRRSLSRQHAVILVAGSIHFHELEIVLGAYATIRDAHPRSILVLAMRFPEEIKQFYTRCIRDYLVARRTDKPDAYADIDILLIDTIGELRWIYGAGDIAFVGGSFVPAGGHNPIEAAMWGIPVLTGPSIFNFREASDRLVAAGAMTIVPKPSALAAAILGIIGDDERYQRMRAGARSAASSGRPDLAQLTRAVDALLA